MNRTLIWLLAASAFAVPSIAGAQDHPAKRLSSIVVVAVEEYAKGVDSHGQLIAPGEYQEASDFLTDAKSVAARLSGPSANGARALLDTLMRAVAARRPPADLAPLSQRFLAALGSEGALDLPSKPIDIAEGQQLFTQNCSQCHGALGMGDGALGRTMHPAPPPVANADTMRDVSLATMFRIVSVGVTGTPMPAWAPKLTPEQRWNIVEYLTSLRATDAHRLEGEGLFLETCASCHGIAGNGGGTVTQGLTHLPPDVGTLAWQAERSDGQLAKVIRDGLPGTAMPDSKQLSDAQVTSLVAYVRSLPLRTSATPARAATMGADGAMADTAAERVTLLLDSSLAMARAGHTPDAGDAAFDSYLAFEPLETTARAKNPGFVAGMERRFADFKAAIRSGRLDDADQIRVAIESNLPAMVDLTRPTAGAWGAFLESFIIITREGFEAILVVGAVVAFLLKTGHRERLRSIWFGVIGALVASAATAVVLRTVLSAVPASQEFVEGFTLLIAVVVLFSVSYWLISKVEAAKWQKFIREKVTNALNEGGGKALAFVAFLAVYREGAETALFYQALFNQSTHVALPLTLGIIAGFAVLAVVFTLFYKYGVRIPLRPFFAVTSALLYYMAFVFAGKGIKELQEGNVVPITVIPHAPHIEALGIYPTLETLGAQLVLLLLFVFALLKTFWPKRAVTLPTVAPEMTTPASPSADVDVMTARLASLQAQADALEARLRKLDA